MNLTDTISFIHQLADAAGEVVRTHYRQRLVVEDKHDGSPVTQADRQVERLLRQMIEEAFPEHGILGEEFAEKEAASGCRYRWVIDPIDGTASFIAGRPLFCTLIALLEDQQPIVGMIDQPVTCDRWVGGKGTQTVHGECAVHSNARVQSLGEAVLATTGVQYFDERQRSVFEAISGQAKQTVYGGDAYNYGLLAFGTIDAVVEANLKPHDMCALVPVVENAGGVVSNWQGEPVDAICGGDIVAVANADLHRALLEKMQKIGL